MRRVLEVHVTESEGALIAVAVLGWLGAVAAVAVIHNNATKEQPPEKPVLEEVVYHSAPPPPPASPPPQHAKIKAVLRSERTKARYISLH